MRSYARQGERRVVGERRWRVDRRSADRRTKAVTVEIDRRRGRDRRMAMDRRVWPDRRLGLGRRGEDNPLRMRLTCQAHGCDERAIVRPAEHGWLCLEHLRRESR